MIAEQYQKIQPFVPKLPNSIAQCSLFAKTARPSEDLVCLRCTTVTSERVSVTLILILFSKGATPAAEVEDTHGIYVMRYSSSIVVRTSSGSWPDTLVAYTPRTYLSRRCHFATQDRVGSASVMTPSNTWDVQLSIWSGEPWRWRNSSQLGHPSSRKR